MSDGPGEVGSVDLTGKSPVEIREAVRKGAWDRPTPGLAPGWARANLVGITHAPGHTFVTGLRNEEPASS